MPEFERLSGTKMSTERVEKLIIEAIQNLEDSGKLPAESSQVVQLLKETTKLSVSTIYRYRSTWIKHVHSKKTSLDFRLVNEDKRRFLISIRIPKDLLLWLKQKARDENTPYQGIIIRIVSWAKSSPLFDVPDRMR